MRLFVMGFLAVALLGGCDEVQRSADEIARDSARSAVDEIIVRQFPSVNPAEVTPYTDCIINNASAQQILTLARAAITGIDQSAITIVTDIARQPQTLTCFIRAGGLLV